MQVKCTKCQFKARFHGHTMEEIKEWIKRYHSEKDEKCEHDIEEVKNNA